MTNYDARSQATTLPTATRLGDHWTQTELNKLQEARKAGMPDRETAVSLHRSLYGVRAAVSNLTERLERAPRHRTKVELPYDRGFTSLAEMGF